MHRAFRFVDFSGPVFKKGGGLSLRTFGGRSTCLSVLKCSTEPGQLRVEDVRKSDIFGRKICLLFAYTVFGIGCLLCGMARNITELIAARAFSGIGGGGITT